MGQNVSTVQEYTPDTKPTKKENSQSLEKPKNKNEDNELNEREPQKTTQRKLVINVITRGPDMPLKMELFIIDAIIVEKLKHSGNYKEIARALKGNLEDHYGGRWNVLIGTTSHASEYEYCLSGIPSNKIDLTYDSHTYTVFKSM